MKDAGATKPIVNAAAGPAPPTESVLNPNPKPRIPMCAITCVRCQAKILDYLEYISGTVVPPPLMESTPTCICNTCWVNARHDLTRVEKWEHLEFEGKTKADDVQKWGGDCQKWGEDDKGTAEMVRNLADPELDNRYGLEEPLAITPFMYWLQTRGMMDKLAPPVNQPGGECVMSWRRPKNRSTDNFKRDEFTNAFHVTKSNALYSILQREGLWPSTTCQRDGIFLHKLQKRHYSRQTPRPSVSHPKSTLLRPVWIIATHINDINKGDFVRL